MRRALAFDVPLLAAVCLTFAHAQEADSMLERYARAEHANDNARLVAKQRVEPRWIGDSERFWYRNDVRGTREFVLVDPDTATRQAAFDHARLAAALGEKLGREVRADRLPFQEIRFEGDLSAVRFETGQRTWRLDLASYALVESPPPAEGAIQPPESPPETERTQARRDDVSPDGASEAFVRDGELWLRAGAGGGERRLGPPGEGLDPITAFWWSPDSRTLAAYRTHRGAHLSMPLIHVVPEQGVRPTPEEHEYDLPGDEEDTHELWLFDAATGEARRAATDPSDWWGPPAPRWSPDGSSFTIEQWYRGFQRLLLARVDARTGESRPIVDERSDTFIASMKRYVEYLDETHEVLWSSERDGWNHLYLYDAETGALKRQVTNGEWVVLEVVELDRASRTVLLKGGGREPGQSPYHAHWYRVGLDDGHVVRLTEGDGTHEVRFSPSKHYLIDRWSRVDLPPVNDLRRADDGSLVCHLEQADASELLATGWQMPEPFVAKGRDGTTDIWGTVYRPSRLDESKAYPVLELIYAGPQGSSIPVAFSPSAPDYTELGLIVVQIDGMGMSNRSKAFHDVCWHNLGDGGFPDRILWMQALHAKYPYIDIERVGITGHSAGGYNAARAVIAFGDFYDAAIACAGNHDHRTDKTWWNEQWMGYPLGPWYEEQSNVAQAAKLTGKLMLIHGMLDHNVNPYASTMQLVDALIAANKDFDLLLLPRDDHGFSGTYAKRRMWDWFTEHLLGETPPREYVFASGSDAGAEANVTVRNTLDVTVQVLWVSFDGELRKYHDLAPGQEIVQHTFVGHEWEAQVDGVTVDHYVASRTDATWEIRTAAP